MRAARALSLSSQNLYDRNKALNTPKIILVVDDEPIITNTLVAILNLCDKEFAAIGVTTVVDALAIVRGVRPDLVLLDVMMPGVDRLEHALTMRNECGCKVLLMSGAGDTAELLDEITQKGHDQFEIVPKPVPPGILIQKVRETIEQTAGNERRPLRFRASPGKP